MPSDLTKQDREFILWVCQEKAQDPVIPYSDIEEGLSIDKEKRDELLTKMEKLNVGWKRDKGLDAALLAFEVNYNVLRCYASDIIEEQRNAGQKAED